MKIRSDSLYAELGRRGLRDEFFVWYLGENPGYRDMRAWLSERSVETSDGALFTLTNYHISVWKIDKAVESSDEEAASLPENVDAKTRERMRAMKFDLVMADLTAQQKLAYLAHDLKERELEEKQRTVREVAVDALLKEAQGNAEAAALLQQFLAAINKRRSA